MATFPQISVVNDPSSGVADADAQAMVAALQRQVDNDFEPLWHARADLTYVPVGQTPPAGYWTIALLGNSDQAGALGYHDLTPDRLPLGKVFAGGGILLWRRLARLLATRALGIAQTEASALG